MPGRWGALEDRLHGGRAADGPPPQQRPEPLLRQQQGDRGRPRLSALLGGGEPVPPEDGANFCTENGYIFMETSCLKNSNVADAFETLIIMTNNDIIKKEKENKENNYEIKKRNKMSLSVHKKHKKSKKNFC